MAVAGPSRPSGGRAASRLERARRRHLLLVLLPTVAVIVAVFLWPLVMLFIGAFRTSPLGSESHWTASAFAVLEQPAVHAAFWNSVVLGLATTSIGVVLGTILAFLAVRSDMPFRGLITPVMLVMFATPTFFYALGFSLLANPYTGVLNDLARALVGTRVTPFNVESLAGLVVVMSFRVASFIYLSIIAAFRAIDSSLEDASLTSGVSRIGTLFRIDIPLLAPALTGAGIIALIAGLHTFDFALVLGEPAGIRTLATQIFHSLNSTIPPNFTSASFLGSLVVLIGLALGYVQYRLLGGRAFVTVTGKSGAAHVYRLGRWRWTAAVLVLLYFFIASVLPFSSLLFATFQPYPGVYGTLTLNNFTRVLSAPNTALALGNTLVLSVSVGALAMALAFHVASLSRRLGRGGATALRLSVTIPYAMPGVVAGLAITWAFIGVPGLRTLYGTLWMMTIGLLVVVIPYAIQIAYAALAQVSPELHSAGRLAGASQAGAFRDISAPLYTSSFLFGWYITGVTVAGNLDIPLLLGGTGLVTVPSAVYALNNQGAVGQAAALLIILISILIAVGTAGLLLVRALSWVIRRRDAGYWNLPASEPLTKAPRS